MTYEDAIFWLDELKRAYIRNGDEEFDRQRKEAVTLAIDCVKSCQKGKWIMDIGVGECSRCHWIITAGDEEINNYCPHCGAYMRGEE